MKRYIGTSYRLLAMGIMATTFMSCSNEEPVEHFNPETYIGFHLPAVSMSGPEISEMGTRGIKYDAFPKGGTFGVLGYLKSNDNDAISDWSTKYQFLSPDIFNKKPVTYNESGMCSYTGLVRWAEEKGQTANLYTFFAYYPNEGNFNIAYSGGDRGAPKFTYTMPFSGTGLTLNNDAAVDAMMAVKYNHTKAMGNVDFTFGHLMTAIRFKVNNYDDDTPVKINTISLSGDFYRSTTLDYTPVAGANHLSRTTNTNDTYNGTYTFYDNSAEPLEVVAGTSTFVGDGSGTIVLLLPGIDDTNTVTGLGNSVSFSCNYKFMNEFDQTGGSDLNYPFEPGTLYTINLNFIGDSFTINITSEKWDDGSNNDIIIQ